MRGIEERYWAGLWVCFGLRDEAHIAYEWLCLVAS
jgi:hypothetical protein